MRKFLSKISFFLLPVLLLAMPLDYFLSKNLRNSTSYFSDFEAMADIYNSNAACDIAVYGSSRAHFQINPRILEDSLKKSVYNFGAPGHNFLIQYLRHLEFIKYNGKPHQIILAVDMFTLQKKNDLFGPIQFLPYMLWNPNIQRFTSPMTGFTNTDFYVPVVRYFGRAEALNLALWNALGIRKKIKNNAYRGFEGIDKPWVKSVDKMIADNYTVVSSLDPAAVDLFEKFIDECRASKIGLTLVYTPEQIDGQKFISNRNDIMGIFRDLSKKHHLVFFDYSNDSLNHHKEFFYNADHLNKKGADLFSSKLAADLKSIER